MTSTDDKRIVSPGTAGRALLLGAALFATACGDGSIASGTSGSGNSEAGGSTSDSVTATGATGMSTGTSGVASATTGDGSTGAAESSTGSGATGTSASNGNSASGQSGWGAATGGSSGAASGVGTSGSSQSGQSPVADAGPDATSGSMTGTSGSRTLDGGATVPSFTTMWSATVVATPSQQLMSASGSNTYRTIVRTRASGKLNWAFWVSNGVDSTYSGGPAMPNKIGGSWTIEAAYVGNGGTSSSGSVVAGSQVQVTFGGSPTKSVAPGEKFWSDPVSLDLPAGSDLAFTWTLSGTGYPFVSASFLTTYRASGKNLANQEAATGFSPTTSALVAPEMIASDRPITDRFCFLGDSITQGVGSSKDTYGYWAAKIAAGLDPGIGVWNLGSGWARAADASSDGYWLYKAKQCTEVAVILGVNDMGSSGSTSTQVLADITTILAKLKQNNPAVKTILFTIPTFNFTGAGLNYWRTANTTIRSSTPPTGTDRVFDIAAVLSQPAPNDGSVKTEYLSTTASPHPNDLAGTDIASAFLSWYAK